jgi:hypothetical protein
MTYSNRAKKTKLADGIRKSGIECSTCQGSMASFPVVPDARPHPIRRLPLCVPRRAKGAIRQISAEMHIPASGQNLHGFCSERQFFLMYLHEVPW